MSFVKESFWRHDGPYSWIILLTIIVNQICVGYLFATIGLLTDEYTSLLGVKPAQANLVGSTLLGVFIFTVSINTLLVKYLGCRLMSAIATVMSIGGFLSSAFATQLWHLIVGYSFVTGWGMSISLTSSIAIVPHYFKKRSNAAYMATALGNGIAVAVIPYVYKSIRDVASYRDTTLYFLPLMLCMISAPLLYKPQLPKEKVESVTSILKSYTHPFKKYVTGFYLVNSYFWNAGHVGVSILMFTYINGISGRTTATSVQTVLGIMEAVGGVGLTLVLIRFKLNHFTLHIACNMTAGLACVLLGAIQHDAMFYISGGIIGLIHSITLGNMACVCRHLYSLSDVEYAFGFQEAVGGVGGFIGAFTAGLIQSHYGQTFGFYYLGAHLVMAGIVMVLAGLRPDIWKPHGLKSDENTNSGSTDLESSNTDSELAGHQDVNGETDEKQVTERIDNTKTDRQTVLSQG